MDGAHAFFLESGNLALDLLNTRAGTEADAPELLGSPAELRAWMDATRLASSLPDGLVPDAPPGWRRLFDEALRLRLHIERIVVGLADGVAPGSHDVFGINRVLTASRRTTSLVMEGRRASVTESEVGASPLTILSPVARAAAELVRAGRPRRTRTCASPSCHRWFVDTSKGGRRRWCSMAECGNRAKARSHRLRQATG